MKILFVCMGNICRSPAAEGVLKHMVQSQCCLKVDVSSRGIGNWHIGQLPDIRMRQAAKERGIDLDMTAKQIQREDFDQYDCILAADKEVMNYLYRHASTPKNQSKIALMTAYSTAYQQQEVPDPYYAPDHAFETVLDMLEDACKGIISHIVKT